MTWLLSLFTGSNSIIAALVAAAALALGSYVKGRLAGAKAERNKQAVDRIEAIKARKELDDEIADLGHADLDTRFKRWLQDDGR